MIIPAGICLFKVNNRNTRTKVWNMLKVKIKPPKRRHCSQAVSILVNFNLDSETSRSLWILHKFEATPSLNPFSKVIYTKYPLPQGIFGRRSYLCKYILPTYWQGAYWTNRKNAYLWVKFLKLWGYTKLIPLK